MYKKLAKIKYLRNNFKIIEVLKKKLNTMNKILTIKKKISTKRQKKYL